MGSKPFPSPSAMENPTPGAVESGRHTPAAPALTVSVVIPAFNAARFLEEALRSVWRQTRQPNQVIVVDDGSTDDSAAIARELGAETLVQGANLGQAVARNVGIGVARGDVVAFLDADDYWHPNHLESVIGLLEKHAEASVAFTLAQLVGDVCGVWWKTIPPNVPTDALGQSIVQVVPLITASAVRRQAVQALGGFDPAMPPAEDYDFFLRMARHRHLFVCTYDITATYRKYAGQSSKRIRIQKLNQLKSMRRCYDDFRRTEEPERVEWFEDRMRDMLAKNFRGYFYADRPLVLGSMLLHSGKLPKTAWLRVRWGLQLLAMPVYVAWWRLRGYFGRSHQGLPSPERSLRADS